MKPAKLFSIITLPILLITSTALYADATSHKQKIDTLFQLTDMEKKIQESVESVVMLQLRQNPQLAQQKEKVFDFFARHIGWPALKDDIAKMYMDTFSEKELDEINAFYITPAGQKVIKVLPDLVQKRNQLAMQRLQENIGELQKIIDTQSPY
jgi:hypothetical protein